MSILFISYAFYPSLGGIESSALVYLHEFHRQGHEVVVITDTALEDEKELDWPKIYRKPRLSLQWSLAREADVIFHHNPAFSYFLPSLAGRPTVFSLQTWVSRVDRSISWRDRIKLITLAKFSCIANSRATAAHLAGPSTVIENAYDDTVFYSNMNQSERTGAAFVGRLVSDKGVETAVAAIEEVSKRGLDLPLKIIGSGPEEENIRQQVKALGLSHLVSFLGKLQPEQVAKELNRVKYLLVPSKWAEPFGIVALEGIACGCIPLGTNQGGLVDAIGKCGPLFEKDNVHQLAEWLVRLENEPQLAANYRQHHPAHLESHSPSIVAERYLQVFEMAVADRQRKKRKKPKQSSR